MSTQPDKTSKEGLLLEDAWYPPRPAFRIVATAQSETHVDFSVFEIVAWSAEVENEPVKEELYLTAYMKWDNCNHFNFGKEVDGKQDGYLHICGGDAMDNHLKLMRFLYDYAFEVMGRDNEKLLKGATQ